MSEPVTEWPAGSHHSRGPAVTLQGHGLHGTALTHYRPGTLIDTVQLWLVLVVFILVTGITGSSYITYFNLRTSLISVPQYNKGYPLLPSVIL